MLIRVIYLCLEHQPVTYPVGASLSGSAHQIIYQIRQIHQIRQIIRLHLYYRDQNLHITGRAHLLIGRMSVVGYCLA